MEAVSKNIVNSKSRSNTLLCKAYGKFCQRKLRREVQPSLHIYQPPCEL
jgi:hypothetical protein